MSRLFLNVARCGSAAALLMLVFLLSECGPTTTPPSAPVIVAGVTNAKLTSAMASTPAIVSISTIAWQTRNPKFPSTYTWGWLEDALVANPFAFQILININLGNTSFSLLDAGGTALASVATRSNASHTCLAPSGVGGIPGTECYWSPGNSSSYHVPPPVPTASAVY